MNNQKITLNIKKTIIYFTSLLFVFIVFSCNRTSCTDFPIKIDKVTFSETNESITIYGSVTNKSGHFVNELKLSPSIHYTKTNGDDGIVSFEGGYWDWKLDSEVLNNNETKKFQKTLYMKHSKYDNFRYDSKKAKLGIGSSARNSVGYHSWKDKSFDDYYKECEINITKEWKEYVLLMRKKYKLN